jgi:hypothetical protein
MEEKLVLFETAKLLKEKGFRESVHAYYDINDGYKKGYALCYHETRSEEDLDLMLAPTLSLAQQWLREVHKVDIQILRNKPGYDEYRVEIYKTSNLDTYFFGSIKEDDEYIKWFKFYEEALEAGLEYALNLIK